MAARRLAISSLLCEDDTPTTAPVAGPSTTSLLFPSHAQRQPSDPYPSSSSSYSHSPEPKPQYSTTPLLASPDVNEAPRVSYSASAFHVRRAPSPQSYPTTDIPSYQSHSRRYTYEHEIITPDDTSRPGSQGSSEYPVRRQQAHFEFPRQHNHPRSVPEQPPQSYASNDTSYPLSRPRSGTSASSSTTFYYPPPSLSSPSITPSHSPVDTYHHRQLSRSPILPIQRTSASPLTSYHSQSSYATTQTRSPYTLSPAFPTSHHPPASPGSPYIPSSHIPHAQLSPVLTRPSLSSLVTSPPLPLPRDSRPHAMSPSLSARAEGFGPLEALVQAATEERRRLSGEMVPPGESTRRHSGVSDGYAAHKSARTSPIMDRSGRAEQPQTAFQYPRSHSGQVYISPVISSSRLAPDDYLQVTSARVLHDGEPPLKRRRSSGESMASRSPVVPVQAPPSVSSHADFVKSLERNRHLDHAVAAADITMKEPSVSSISPSLPVPAVFPVGDPARGVVIIKEKLGDPVHRKEEKAPDVVPFVIEEPERKVSVSKAAKVVPKHTEKVQKVPAEKVVKVKKVKVDAEKAKVVEKPKPEGKPEVKQAETQEDPHEWLLEHYTSSPPPAPHPVPPLPSVSSHVVPEPKRLPTPPVPRVSAKIEKDASSMLVSPRLKPTKHRPGSASAAAHAQQDKKIERSVPVSPSVDADIDMELSLAAETSKKGTKKHVPPLPKREGSVDMDVDNELLSLLDDEPRPKQHSRPRSPPPPARSPIPPPAPAPVPTPAAAQHPPKPKASQKKPLLEPEHKRATPTPSVVSERESMPPPASTNRDETVATSVSRDGSVAPTAASAKKKDSSAKPTPKPKAAPKVKAKATTKSKPAKTKDSATASGSTLSPAVTNAVLGKGKKSSPLATSVPKRAFSSIATGASRSRSTSVAPGTTVEADKKVEEVPEADEEVVDDKLYCICKTTYDEDRVMIACDRCDEWYHTQCVGMSDTEVDLVDQFICPVCIAANPTLKLKTTYKQRCAAGLTHPHPASSSACHKPSRGAFSKYCSQECGITAMRLRIERWGGDKERLWESVKDAQRREGVVVRCEAENDVQEVVKPTKSKTEREMEILNHSLDKVALQRDETKQELEVVLWREKLVALATARADTLDECGWDQRLCFGDEEYAEFGPGVLESYEEEAAHEGDEMQVDGAQEVGEWWCRGKKKCERHAGWQKLRQAEVKFEMDTIEEVLSKLTAQEREIRKQIEDVLESESRTAAIPVPVLQPLNGQGYSNGVVKQKTNTDGVKKGKKRKEMTE
ncbi:hypothetical protein EUX98_g59 [Antrodiella citrinella]|uniref:PHD-type domain-containing protein n=1 Tax=Antrodiella citrinella TaxID=2447956 RepID=A0A4S4NDI6_9APHY|nr:hypothetical protein EUX98_g59 [Antrodiella citrinella]